MKVLGLYHTKLLNASVIKKIVHKHLKLLTKRFTNSSKTCTHGKWLIERLVNTYHWGMLNERLKNLRLAKGLTLQQVGDAFGISRASVSSWETGTNQPDPRKLEKLADLFETSVEFLITGQTQIASENSNNNNTTNVPYIPWELVASSAQSNSSLQVTACLYTQPTNKSFATRYVGSSDLNWQQGAIPAGAIVIVDRGVSISHGCYVLANKSNHEIVIGQIFNSDVPGTYIIKFCNSRSSSKVDKSISIIGVILEWRIGAKL